MTEIAKFLKKIRIDNEQNLGDMAEKIGLSAAYLSAVENNKRIAPKDMKENIFREYNLSKEQQLELSRLIAESRKKVEIELSSIQEDMLPECVDTAVMFANDLSKMNRQQLTMVKEILIKIKEDNM